jgi:hypothetical protein
LIEDETVTDKSVSRLREIFLAELESAADATVAVVREAVLVSDRTEEPVEENLIRGERVDEALA